MVRKTSLENGIVETIKWIKNINYFKRSKIYTQKMNILILGGGGYVGTPLTTKLLENKKQNYCSRYILVLNF